MPKARWYKKSGAAAAAPSYLGHVITENRNGLVVRAMATTAEREAALAMLDTLERTGSDTTLGADKGYQQEAFVEPLRQRNIAPHVAEYDPNPDWPSLLTAAERNHPGFGISREGLWMGQTGPAHPAGQAARTQARRLPLPHGGHRAKSA